MCNVENSDGSVTVLHERHPIAKKEHKCSECRRFIKAGESYMVERYVFDGEAHTHKTCLHCQIARDWLIGECSGFIYGGIAEDIYDHAREGYGFGVARLSAGMERQWQRKDGRQWPIPKMPPYTFAAPDAAHGEEGK